MRRFLFCFASVLRIANPSPLAVCSAVDFASYAPYSPIVDLPESYHIHNFTVTKDIVPDGTWSVGRYDEIRPTMYDQAHFAEASTSVDGFSGVRDVHVGLDIGGPVGTPVFAWRAGVVVHAGYNPAEGDYGNVVVTEHEVGGVPVWSLYGHLDAGTLALSPPGRRFEAGDVLGAFGARGENGGWAPHVHFQLAVARPATHDLPGVVSRADRDAALASYPDPRHVLGPLYD